MILYRFKTISRSSYSSLNIGCLNTKINEQHSEEIFCNFVPCGGSDCQITNQISFLAQTLLSHLGLNGKQKSKVIATELG